MLAVYLPWHPSVSDGVCPERTYHKYSGWKYSHRSIGISAYKKRIRIFPGQIGRPLHRPSKVMNHNRGSGGGQCNQYNPLSVFQQGDKKKTSWGGKPTTEKSHFSYPFSPQRMFRPLPPSPPLRQVF